MGSAGPSTAKSASAVHAERVGGSIPMRTLGRTGERARGSASGGLHLGEPDFPEAESVRITSPNRASR